MTVLFADPNTEVELRKSKVALVLFYISPPIGERNLKYFEEGRICFP